VPWCDDCARFLTPTTLSEKGECPSCGRVVAEPKDLKVPWHFKLLVVATVLYLGFRAWQGVVWLAGKL
jgi:hypothetical protein